MTTETTTPNWAEALDTTSAQSVPQVRDSPEQPSQKARGNAASAPSPTGRPTNRALPGWAIDLLTDGVPAADLLRDGNRAVIGALVRTAMSAQHRDWSVMEWEALVNQHGRTLVTQLRKGARPQTAAQTQKVLQWAWDAAWENRTTTPAWGTAEAQRETRARVQAARTAASDNSALQASDRAVLRYAAAQAEERRITRVALPWRAVAEATGLGERTTKNALSRLTAAGHLALAQRGAPSGPKATKRRANVYELAPNKSRGTRPVGPPTPDVKVGPAPRTHHRTPRAAQRPRAADPSRPTTAQAAKPGLRLTRHPDGVIVLESTPATESALLSLLATLLSDQPASPSS